ncbi:isatin hydrolase [Trichonephila clavipes]|nr:isatin hydrolase [Trichonephila clavipes]
MRESFNKSRKMSLLSRTVCLLATITVITCAPIPFEMVDMSYTFDENTLHWPTNKKFELTVTMNGTAKEGFWMQTEEYFSGIHVGTHMDAPCHFAKGRWTVDQIPLNHLVAPAAVIDITKKAELDRDALVQIEDLQNWEMITGHTLNGTIIMIRSGWGRRWPNREAYTGTADYDPTKLHFPGMSKEAAQWLVDKRQIYGVGIDTLSVDNGVSQGFPTHRILYDKNIFGLENVANMEKLPIYGTTLYVMPMKIGKASGAPTRIMATYPKHLPFYWGK